MENSAYEALIIGINVTIFVIATTIAIFLLTTVFKLSNLANESVIGSKTGNVMLDGTQNQKRIVTGSELINYYTNNLNGKDITTITVADPAIGYYTNYPSGKDILQVDISGTKVPLGNYIKSQGISKTFTSKKFEVVLEKVISATDTTVYREVYVFK